MAVIAVSNYMLRFFSAIESASHDPAPGSFKRGSNHSAARFILFR